MEAESVLDHLASSAEGVVTRAEALAAGLTPAELEHRLRAGSLITVHRGVYRVGHRAPSRAATYSAALKACGVGSKLSGLAGAHWLRLVRNAPAVVEVTAATDRRVPGVIVHRSRRIEAAGWIFRGLAVTTPAWTLLDIAGRLSNDDLARACHEAWVQHRCGAAQVEIELARRQSTSGSDRLRRIMCGDEPLVLSKLERGFLGLLRTDGRELPETNILVDLSIVDCRWPLLGLTIELDSYRFHASRQAWERDRRREREARRRGDTFIRYTWGDVFERAEETLAEVRTLVPIARKPTKGS